MIAINYSSPFVRLKLDILKHFSYHLASKWTMYSWLKFYLPFIKIIVTRKFNPLVSIYFTSVIFKIKISCPVYLFSPEKCCSIFLTHEKCCHLLAIYIRVWGPWGKNSEKFRALFYQQLKLSTLVTLELPFKL